MERTSVTPERTELEWTYQPTDFFETPYRHADSKYHLLVDGGKAIATLGVAQDPVMPQLEERIQTFLTTVFIVRQLQVHRRYDLRGPVVYQHAADRKNVAIRVECAAVLTVADQVDIVVRDAAGNIVRDTKTERIAQHTAILDSVAAKATQSPTLQSLLASFTRSVTDPENELVHVYEIRDALSQHYGSEQTAQEALDISKTEWKRIGSLANVEPLEQGRHRGKHPSGRRLASVAELEEAREIVRRWILAFAAIA
jgi:hypothetical protein